MLRTLRISRKRGSLWIPAFAGIQYEGVQADFFNSLLERRAFNLNHLFRAKVRASRESRPGPTSRYPSPVVPALRLPARAGAQDKLQPKAESWDPCLTRRVSPDRRRRRSPHRQARRVEPPVARAVDPGGAPHAVDRGAERIWDDDKDYYGAGAFKRIAPFGLQHDSRRRQGHQIRGRMRGRQARKLLSITGGSRREAPKRPPGS